MIDEGNLHIYHREVERQCQFGIMAYTDLVNALTKGETDRIWYSVQGFLFAAGNVSKLLWPIAALEARGERLRSSLQVPNTSLLQPRIFRNHFEHFDERLDDWVNSSERHKFVDSNVGPPAMISGSEPIDFLRNLDSSTLAFTFHGDKYELRPIAQEMQNLWQVAKAKIDIP